MNLKMNLKMKGKTISIISFFLLIIIYYVGSGAGEIGGIGGTVPVYERPKIPDDGLMMQWHDGAFCLSCHYSLMDAGNATKISYTCKCHDYRPKGVTRGYKVDSAKILDIHKDIICIRCHIGTKGSRNASFEDYHSIHKKEDCTTCHQYPNGSIQIPEKRNCSDCHASGNPHVVHTDHVERLCIPCHGEYFAKKFIGKEINVSTIGNITVKSIEVREYPTITRVLDRIYKIILNG